MNTLTFNRKSKATRLYASLTIVSLLLSALPAAFFIAEAASNLSGPVAVDITDVGGGYASGVINASLYENLVFSFDYDSTALDVTTDSFTYGWRDSIDSYDLGTIDGVVGSDPSEINSIVVGLPSPAQVADLKVYIYVTAEPGNESDEVKLNNVIVEGDLAPVVCAPQYDVAGPTDIQNTDTGNFFDSINDALADCDTDAGDTIALLGDILISDEVVINKPIIIVGNGKTITTDVEFESSSADNSVIEIVGTDSVILENFTLDGSGGTDIHGINIYEATNVALKDLTVSNNDKAGITVNSSEVTIENITTSGNGTSGINADQKTSMVTVLNVKSISNHDELAHIFVDDRNKEVTINDVNKQYAKYPFVVSGLNIDGDLYRLRDKGMDQTNGPLPKCMAEVQARVVLREEGSFKTNGDADSTAKVFLGDDTSVEFGTWFNLLDSSNDWIVDDEMAENFSDPTSKNGIFVSREGDGLVKVALYGFNGPGNTKSIKASIEFSNGEVLGIDEMPLFYQVDEHDSFDPNSSNAGFDEVTLNGSSAVDFDFWTGSAGDGISITLDHGSITACDEVGPIVKTSTVTMCKLDTNGNGLANWRLALLGQEVGTLAVAPNGITQSMTNVSDGNYVLKANGTYVYRNGQSSLADARFSARNATEVSAFATGGYTPLHTPWMDLLLIPENALSLQVNNVNAGTTWGNIYNPEHTYYSALSHSSGDINFNITDTAYDDNSGWIDVTLFNGFVGDTTADGCVVFENVPYGTYQIEEAMQYGFENTSGLGEVTVDGEVERFDIVNFEPKYSTVTMCKLDQEGSKLSGWELALLGEEVVGSVAVKPDGTTQSILNVPTGDYLMKAEGTFVYRNKQGASLADARFSERDQAEVAEFSDGGYNPVHTPWMDLLLIPDNLLTSQMLSLQVNNGEGGDAGDVWGDMYSSDHVYYGDLTHISGNVDFKITDSAYDDNSGSIDVSLYRQFAGVTEANEGATDGCVVFQDVPYGTYQVEEVDQAGFENTSGLGEVTVDEEVERFDIVNEETSPDEVSVSVSVSAPVPGPETQGSSGGGSSATRIAQLSSAPEGVVLGAATSAPALCPFLTDYMQIGAENDKWGVTKLQLFLNIFVAPNPVTGVFGETTDANVKTFQEKYRSEILDTWFERGIVPHNRPTGFVYKTTQWKINNLICPENTTLPDFTGEDLSANIDL